MHFNDVPRNAFLDEETQNFLPLVTLELNDLTKNFILNQVAVTSEFLLESLQNLLEIVGCGDDKKIRLVPKCKTR